MSRLMSQRAAAKYCGIGRDRFRALIATGKGPPIWNPDDGRAMYVDTVLDTWMASRNDTTKQIDRRAS